MSQQTFPQNHVTDRASSPDEPAEVESPSWGSYLEASAEQLVILWGVYVFSIGPMYWMWVRARHVDGHYWVRVLYEPLWELAGMIPIFGEWLNWYVRLWIL